MSDPSQFLLSRRGVTVGSLATLATLVALLVGLLIGGGAAPLLLEDPGPIVRWGLPIAKALTNLSMAVTVGTLVFGAFALQKGKSLTQALNLAAISAVAWVLFGLANLLLTYLSITGSAISFGEAFSSGLWMFATQIQLGQYLALNLLAALILSLLILLADSLTATALLAALALVALVPLALTGHAAGTQNHAMAVNSIGIHLVAVTIWVGGLVALFVVRGRDDSESASIVSRYSSLALFSFGLVAVSGTTSAFLRIGTFANLATPYGVLVVLKALALVALGIFGAIYRRRLLGNFAVDLRFGRLFWRMATVETAIMGIAIGLATALSRTEPPIDQNAIVTVTPAQILTGSPLPPELTPLTLITLWKPDLIWLLVAILGTFGYLLGVRRLKKRGDSWPMIRTASWIAGMLLLTYITSGPLNAYQEYLFSIHMIAHMMLTMGVPVLLVPGAPVTLLMRAVKKRQDESRGLREWVLWAVHTKYAQFISHPLVAAVLFASSLVVFYFTPIFGWSAREHIGHEWMVLHFLITGYLFVQAVIGIDPGPAKLAYPIRLMLLIGTLAFHAFFGLALMTGNGLLLAEWFGAMGRTWGETPIADQQTGGAIAWGIGELPTAALTLIVSVQWARADKRDATRLDRASDRNNNQDVEDYNDMLAKLAARDLRQNNSREH